MSSSIKDAIKVFQETDEWTKMKEERGYNDISEAEVVRLCPIAEQSNPIAKMDKDLGGLKACKHLRISTNCIDKITNLGTMPNLQIISLGRNKLKSFAGITDAAETIEQIWISYNSISSTAGLEKIPNLQVLYMSNNSVSNWSEVERLAGCPKLRDINLANNPLQTSAGDDWRIEVLKRLPNLKTIDTVPVEDEEREAAKA